MGSPWPTEVSVRVHPAASKLSNGTINGSMPSVSRVRVLASRSRLVRMAAIFVCRRCVCTLPFLSTTARTRSHSKPVCAILDDDNEIPPHDFTGYTRRSTTLMSLPAPAASASTSSACKLVATSAPPIHSRRVTCIAESARLLLDFITAGLLSLRPHSRACHATAGFRTSKGTNLVQSVDASCLLSSGYSNLSHVPEKDLI
mmetsp:Transcript_8896/g.16011  ORF Transcript_8896/g.16011 Transcript_8896/m.16011 type:complete len:201 (+) Transcript_8896:497-1099(+)